MEERTLANVVVPPGSLVVGLKRRKLSTRCDTTSKSSFLSKKIILAKINLHVHVSSGSGSRFLL